MRTDTLDEQAQRLLYVASGEEISQTPGTETIVLGIDRTSESQLIERVKIWANDNKKLAFASIGTGQLQDIEDESRRFTLYLTKEFVDLPSYPYKTLSLEPAIQNIRSVVEQKFATCIVYARPDDDLTFSPVDKMLALIADQLATHPLFHVLVDSKGSRVKKTFFHCWCCPNSPFYKIDPKEV